MNMRVSKYELAKYPFLTDVKEFISRGGITDEEFISRGVYDLGYDLNDVSESILDRSLKRIYVALNGEVFNELEDVDKEVISFLLALIMLNNLGMNIASKRFALSEARRVERFLENDLKNGEIDLLEYIYKDIFGLEVINEDDIYKISVAEYLKRASRFHDPYWKLINKDVYDGYVHLDLHDIVRLIREEVSILIYDKINKVTIKKLPESIKSRVEVLRRYLLSDARFKPLQSSNRDYPPCITHILDMLDKGENPPHTARFLLATYMLSIGKSIDEVCHLFENAPDYNEKVTRYQVEFLAGKRGSRRSYNCPNCDKIASENLCHKTDECDSIKSPLQFKIKR